MVEPTALVCEDDPAARRAVEAILRRCGFSLLTTVSTAAEGVARAAAVPVDVVVLDAVVTGDRGLGVISSFLELRPACAVVVLSPFESLSEIALGMGAFAVVSGWSADPWSLERCLGEAAEKVRNDRVMAAGRADQPTPAPVRPG